MLATQSDKTTPLVAEVEGSKCRIGDAGVRVDAHQAYRANTEAAEQDAEIRTRKAVGPPSVIDDVVALLDELRNDLSRCLMDISELTREMACNGPLSGASVITFTPIRSLLISRSVTIWPC
jgi:hypothetical protein